MSELDTTTTDQHNDGDGRPQMPAEKSWKTPFLWIEWAMEWCVYGLDKMALFHILEYAGKFTIVIGIAVYLYDNTPTKRRDRAIAEAWQVVASMEGKRISGGRLEQLAYLAEQNVDLSGISLHGAFLPRLVAPNAVLTKADLNDADVSHADFQEATLLDADLREADLTGANLRGADISLASLVGAKGLTAAQVQRASNWEKAFYDVAFRSGLQDYTADLAKANLQNRDLRDADLKRADLGDANLSGANLHGANLEHARMVGVKGLTAKQVELAANWEKAFFDSEVRKKLSSYRLDFGKADLRNRDLSDADLSSANLREANLDKAKLSQTNLQYATLVGAQGLAVEQVKQALGWEQAIFSWEIRRQLGTYTPDLSGADLRNRDLQLADLSRANLRGANIEDAILDGANLKFAIMVEVKGFKVEQLKNVYHDIDTILWDREIRTELRKLPGYGQLALACSEANFEGVDLSSADLSGANFKGANLKRAILRGADLSSANLDEADLEGAQLGGPFAVVLKDASLVGTRLDGANLWGVDLTGLDLSNTSLAVDQVKQAMNWNQAKYSDEFRKKLEAPATP